jgi:uncharacterized OsmC-like protein
MAEAAARQYTVHGRSTETFGRVLLSSRDQHLVADGPVSNGCPGEAIGPAELFLSGVAACGVELLQVLARDQDVPLRSVSATIQGTMAAERIRPDVAVFGSVRLDFRVSGVSDAQAQDLVERFKRR